MLMASPSRTVQMIGKVGVLTSVPLSFPVPQTAAITMTLSSASMTSSMSIRKSSKVSRQTSHMSLSPSRP